MDQVNRRESARKHVDKKLRSRLLVYGLISIVLFSITSFEVISGVVSPLFAIVGVLIGCGIGFISARMFHLSWDHDGQKIVSKLDSFGVIILVLYIISAFFRRMLIGYFVHGPAVGGVSISIVTGIMIGRVLGTRGRIIQLLREQHIF